jgi:glucose-6-phosphate 1-dehydrogenase
MVPAEPTNPVVTTTVRAAAGSWGPAESNELLARDGRMWGGAAP